MARMPGCVDGNPDYQFFFFFRFEFQIFLLVGFGIGISYSLSTKEQTKGQVHLQLLQSIQQFILNLSSNYT